MRSGNMPAGMFPGARPQALAPAKSARRRRARESYSPRQLPQAPAMGLFHARRTRAKGKEDSNRGHAPPGNPRTDTRRPLVGGLRFSSHYSTLTRVSAGVRAARARVRRSAASPDEMGASPYSTPSRCLRS